MAQLNAQKLSSLSALLPRPVILDGIFRDILTRHFQEGQIEHHELIELLWRGVDRSNILIEMNTRWNPKTTGNRPAVIIKMNDFANVRIGIADRHQMSPADGRERFTTFWSGSHTLFCIGGSGAQAKYLASEVQRELTEFGPVIQSKLGFTKFRVMSMGTASKLEEATENSVCPVTVGYLYEENWIIDPQAPRLSKVSLNLSTLLE